MTIGAAARPGNRRGTSVVPLLAIACTLASCQRATPVLAVPAPPTVTLSLSVVTGSAPAQRHLEGLGATGKVRLTIEAADLAQPFSADVDATSGHSGQNIVVTGAPAGKKRVVTLRWLDGAGQPVTGLHYSTFCDLVAEHPRVTLDSLSTVEGDVVHNVLAKNAGLVAGLDEPAMATWITGMVTGARSNGPRFLDTDAMATAITSSTLPAANQAWLRAPGWVSVSLADAQLGLTVRASLDDDVSTPVFTTVGDGLLVGPLPARTAPYTLMVAPLPNGKEQMGPDMQPRTFQVTIQPNQTAIQPPVSFVASTPGKPLPEDAGHGECVLSSDGGTLWLVGGVRYPGDLATQVSQVSAVVPAGKVYRYTPADGWASSTALPDTAAIYGATLVAVDTKLFRIGGYDKNGKSLRDIEVIDTAANPPTVTTSRLPANQSIPGSLTESAGAVLGGSIYLTGGTAGESGGVNGTPFDGMVVGDPKANTWAAQPANGLITHRSMASAVLDGKWYVFGGYDSDTQPIIPVADAQVFDPATSTWTTLAPMPTPRNGATAAVLDGKIWVVGGEERRGAASRAVEVFDPATGVWSRRAPLRLPRSYAAVGGFHDGGKAKIVVAGGAAGLGPAGFPMPLPKDRTEELAP